MKEKIICLAAVFIISISLCAGKTVGQKISDADRKKAPEKLSAKEKKVEDLIELSKKYYYKDPKKKMEYAAQALNLAREINYPKGEAKALVNISRAYLRLRNYKKMLEYGEKSLKISQEIGFTRGISESLTIIGTGYYYLGHIETALKNFRQALEIAKERENIMEIGEALNNIGTVYLAIDEYEKALEYYLKALDKWEEIGYKIGIGTTSHNVASIYNNLKKYKQSLKYYRESLRILKETGDKQNIAHTLNSIGLVYYSLKDYDQALDYYSKALKIENEIEDNRGIASTTDKIGMVYCRLKDYRKALEYHKKALAIWEELGEKGNFTDCLLNIASIYSQLPDYDQALAYFNKSLKIATEIKSKFMKSEIYRGFSELYAAKGDYKKALEYHKRFHQTDKELLDEKGNKQINELQTRYETEKKEREIDVLKKDKKIQELRFSKERFARYALIIGLILVLVIFALLFKKYLYLFAFWKKQKYIGQFRLIDKIGSGGMGTIFKAQNIHDKSAVAAVKILREELFSDATSKKRFKREAAIIDKLEHPHIVKIFERGESKQTLFIAMEFLEGRTLENKINEEGPLKLRESLHIMVQISDALAFIHSKNIIHRDLKPANVMLIENNGDTNFVKLLDFGLAKIELETRLTQSGNFLGTLQYIAPEQVLDAHSVLANDIFSLGVTFYHMLCGKSPFAGETAIDIMRQIIVKEPPGLLESRPDIPGELNQLVMEMMNKNPGQRPSAESIKDTLLSFDARQSS